MEDAFLSALHESPNDEATWLALADWLEDDGQSQRAELVRLVRRLRSIPVMKRTKARVAGEGRIAELLNAGVRPVVPEIINSVGMRLALIPPGIFRMGSPTSESQRNDDEAAHEVEITQPFYMSVFVVTQRLYQSIMGSNPSYFSPSGEGLEDVQEVDTREFPAEWMTYGEAKEFCRRLTRSERQLKRKYRIPTEAEWEYACRGGSASSTAFAFGTSLSGTQANFDGLMPYGGEMADEESFGRPCPVGQYRPNVFGLYDMHGNVHEWCSDWYDGDYYETSPRIDPTGPARGTARVQRGGCWRCSGKLCRSSDRASDRPSVRDLNVGIRVVMTVSGK